MDFLLYALIGGGAVALAAGQLGPFVIWRRMSYFGDSLAHSALLGIALGMIAGAGLNLGVLVTSLLFAGLLVTLEHQRRLGMDALLGIFAHGSLALGLVGLSLAGGAQVDLMSFLVGDILAVSRGDALLMVATSLVVIVGLRLIFDWLLSLSIHEELSLAEGWPVLRTRLIFMGLMAFFVMSAIKVVGVLLISSLLIIPAAAARAISRSPEMMCLIASGIGFVTVVLGLGLSFGLDTPAGPSIVVVALGFFGLSLAIAGLVSKSS
ncbi:MAG: hypothetical protein EP347_12140 [Alphaproteobacteria bacterium]|nr:MAG: hypothetical protein EP347_12140 [Alphaproteobacteria bacterium]